MYFKHALAYCLPPRRAHALFLTPLFRAPPVQINDVKKEKNLIISGRTFSHKFRVRAREPYPVYIILCARKIDARPSGIPARKIKPVFCFDD